MFSGFFKGACEVKAGCHVLDVHFKLLFADNLPLFGFVNNWILFSSAIMVNILNSLIDFLCTYTDIDFHKTNPPWECLLQ